MYFFFFVVLISLKEVISLNFTIGVDDYFLSVMVDGIKTNIYQNKENITDYNEGKQRNMITFEVKNGDHAMGIGGTLKLDGHTFSIEKKGQPFLRCNKSLYLSYYYNGFNLTGYNGSVNEINYFNFTLPKIILIEYTPSVKSEGIDINLSELGDSTTNIKFTSIPLNGNITINSNLINKNISYPINSLFHYHPNDRSVVDQITYNVYNSTSISYEGLLLLTIIEGNKCHYDETVGTPDNHLICEPCLNESYHKINDEKECLTETTKRNYYLKENLYYKCNDACETCEKNESNCLKCKKPLKDNKICCLNYFYLDESDYYNCLGEGEICSGSYPFIKENTKECLKECPYGYKLIKEKNECVKECPEDVPFFINNSKECVASCPDPYPLLTPALKLCDNKCNIHFPVLFQSEKLCLSECPNKLKPNDLYICSLNLQDTGNPIIENNTVQYNSTVDIDTFKNSITDTVESLVNQLSSENESNEIIQKAVITSENFTFYLYPNTENSTKPSKINLGECESILRDIYKIPENELLLVGQLEYQTDSSISNSNQYTVYDIRGRQLDLSLCSDLPITISSSIPNIDDIDFNQVMTLFEQDGINVFNTDEKIFIDKCTPYSLNGKDMTISDRRNILMKNISICDDGCHLSNINTITNIIECECVFKETEIKSSKEITKQINYNHSNNFYLFLCYNLFFNFDNNLTNYGFWLMIFSLFMFIFLLAIFLTMNLIKIYAFENKYFFNPNKNLVIKQDKYLLHHEQNVTNIPSINTIETNENKISNNNIPKENEIYIFKFNQLYYEKAIKNNNQSFWLFYYHSIIEKQFILSTFFNNSIIYPVSLRLFILIFHIEAFFFFNSLLYVEQYISNRYKEQDPLNILYIFKNELSKSIYSSLLVLLLGKICIIVTLIRNNFCQIIEFHNFQNYKFTINKLIKAIKTKLLIFVTLIVLISFIFLYFIIIFCNMYHYSQISLLESTLISIGIHVIIIIVLCFFFGVLRFFGIKFKNKILYMIGNYSFNLF